jgi:hypothetical protein
MTVLKPQVVVAGAFVSQERRSHASANGVIVAAAGGIRWSKKAIIIKNMPYTAVFPTLGQMETRIHFGEQAQAVKGRRGLERGLPVAAAYIQDHMKGYRAADRLNPVDYPSKNRRTYHTMAELQHMVEVAKQRQAVAARAASAPTL